MYRLRKVDFSKDEGSYETIAEGSNLDSLLEKAIVEFSSSNPTIHKWSDWKQLDGEDGIEVEIWKHRPVFIGSILMRGKKVVNAMALARKYHARAIRKGDGQEYLIHIMEITKLLYESGFNADIIAAGFCHDLLEDTECTEQEIASNCGQEVLRIVRAVSNDKRLAKKKDWGKKKKKYIASVRKGGEKAIAVCVADKIVNLESLINAYRKDKHLIWSRFNRGKNQKLWFEKSVLKMARQNWDHPLIGEYERLVRIMEAMRTSKERHSKVRTLKDYSVEEFELMNGEERGKLYAESMVRNLNTHDPKEV